MTGTQVSGGGVQIVESDAPDFAIRPFRSEAGELGRAVRACTRYRRTDPLLLPGRLVRLADRQEVEVFATDGHRMVWRRLAAECTGAPFDVAIDQRALIKWADRPADPTLRGDFWTHLDHDQAVIAIDGEEWQPSRGRRTVRTEMFRSYIGTRSGEVCASIYDAAAALRALRGWLRASGRVDAAAGGGPWKGTAIVKVHVGRGSGVALTDRWDRDFWRAGPTKGGKSALFNAHHLRDVLTHRAKSTRCLRLRMLSEWTPLVIADDLGMGAWSLMPLRP